jgi:hypothetical protein
MIQLTGTDAYAQNKPKNLHRAFRPKVKKRELFISVPKSPTHLEALWCKNDDNPRDQKSHTLTTILNRKYNGALYISLIPLFSYLHI